MTSKSVTKGGPNDWVPRAMIKRLEEWGYGNKKVVLVSDGESSIVAVKNAMIAIREPETIPEETPVGEPNANLAEGMVRGCANRRGPSLAKWSQGLWENQ